MYQGQFAFSKNMDHSPWETFLRCVQRYQGDRNVRTFTCSQQYRAMAIAQLNRRSSLRIKSFYGTSENAVKTQIWTAISVYVLLAILKKRSNLETNLCTISQLLDTTLFEKMPLYQLLTNQEYKPEPVYPYKQLS
ncbi:MAG: DUF4372 domain-containing protein [Gammaproteobacteria bacterium]|nr:DUF4372 domain-containing protein [Gammaproteobacteria bacterium]